MSEREVVIVEAVRTPIGRRNGGLSTIHSADLLATALKGLIERSGIDPTEVEQVVGGCVGQVGMQSFNVTRTAWLTAGLPMSAAGHHRRHPVRLLAAGHQHGGQPGRLGRHRRGRGLRHREPEPGPDGVGHGQGDQRRPGHPQELLPPVRVHHASSRAPSASPTSGASPAPMPTSSASAPSSWPPRPGPRIASAPRLVAVDAPDLDEDRKPTGTTHRVERDEGLRETTLEGLANLKPVAREDGVHTAGSSSQISDGAGAVLMMTRDKADALGLTPDGPHRRHLPGGRRPDPHADRADRRHPASARPQRA